MFAQPDLYTDWKDWARMLLSELELRDDMLVSSYNGRIVCTPGSFNNNSTATFTVNVPRARLGMFALASFSRDLETVRLHPAVSANDTVTVIFAHTGGAPATLGEGILRVRVLPLIAGE